ncbi:18171_t:CDS:10 [Entrophospora sp. SA101]|nr:18171_t:CDS:10 [Entrophospora sp. SA101]
MKSQNCKFEVFFKNDKGFGLRLLEPLKKGRFITEFPEASSSYEDLSDITDQWLTQGLWNVVQDKTTIQDTKQLGGIMSKYISHSNEANCVVQKWQVGELIMTGLYAKRDIEQNEELFLDYTVPYTGHGIIDPKPDPLIATDKNFSDNLGKPIENADDVINFRIDLFRCTHRFDMAPQVLGRLSITNDIIILGFFIEALGLDVLRDLLKGDPPNLVTIKKILEILKKLPCDRKYLKFYNDSKIKETLIKLAPKIVQFNDLFQHLLKKWTEIEPKTTPRKPTPIPLPPLPPVPSPFSVSSPYTATIKYAPRFEPYYKPRNYYAPHKPSQSYTTSTTTINDPQRIAKEDKGKAPAYVGPNQLKSQVTCNTPTTNLIITEPCFNLPNIQTTYDEMIFEVYEFKSCFRTIVKETCCYVSKDFLGDLEICRKSTRNNSIVQEYVLPDYSKNPKGYVRERKASGRRNNYSDEQVLYMNNERFTVPEILFNPSDIGMDQAGIPEAIVASINSISPDTQGLFYENVLLVGGNSLFSGYKERIEKDLRVLAPSDYEIKIGIPDNPITYAWHGGSKFAKTNEFKDMSVTKSEYDEHGSNICLKKFDGRRKTRLGEAKPYDTLTNKEVKLILDHNFCSPNNLTGLLYLSDQGGIERRQTSRVIFKELLIEVESPRIDLDGSKAWIKAYLKDDFVGGCDIVSVGGFA